MYCVLFKKDRRNDFEYFALNRVFIQHGFVAAHIDHWENIGSLSYVDVPNVDVFYYKIKHYILYYYLKSHFRKKTHVFKNWTLSHGDRYSFPKVWILLVGLNFVMAINIVCCFPWSKRLISFIFQKILDKSPSWNNTVCLLAIFSSKNGIPWKRKWPV